MEWLVTVIEPKHFQVRVQTLEGEQQFSKAAKEGECVFVLCILLGVSFVQEKWWRPERVSQDLELIPSICEFAYANREVIAIC